MMIEYLFNIAIWVAFGMTVGGVANLLDPHPKEGGMAGAIVLGIVGALLGGFLASIILGQQVGNLNISALSVAVLSALLLLFAQRAFSNP